MLWDLILTSYTINSLPVCCSTNGLLKTWLGKAKYFCMRYNSKTKQKPATKTQGRIFLLYWRPHAKIQALSRKFFFSPKSSLSMVLHSPLQLYFSRRSRLQNSRIFCNRERQSVFERKVWNKCKNGEGEWGETLKNTTVRLAYVKFVQDFPFFQQREIPIGLILTQPVIKCHSHLIKKI